MKLDKFHLLMLDDFSYVTKDQAETSVLFELISARYEHRLITANQPFGQWEGGDRRCHRPLGAPGHHLRASKAIGGAPPSTTNASAQRLPRSTRPLPHRRHT